MTMDTKTLVVGQKVWMQSGDQLKEAVVEEIAENHLRVFIAPSGPFRKWLPKLGDRQPPSRPDPISYSPENENGYSIDFRYDGSQCEVWGWIDAWDPRPVCTEFGPWRLLPHRVIE